MAKKKPASAKKPAPAKKAPAIEEKPPASAREIAPGLWISGDFPEGIELGDFRSMESLMKGLFGGGEPATGSPQWKAKELLDRAYAARDRKSREKLARQALEADPACVDAYVLLGESAGSAKGALEFFERGVAAGEEALGPEFFREEVGHFWGILETRPYMRARAALAHELWKIGRKEEAAGHLRELLRLNPGDNQGNRITLAPWLIELEEDRELAELLDRYDEETAASAYSRALLAFRRQGDGAESRRLLAEAAKINKHVPALLGGREPLPAQGPGFYGPGDKNEAVLYVMSALAGWKSTPGALTWLSGAQKAPKKRVPKAKQPIGPSEIGKERLRRVPQAAVTWEVDARQLDHWIDTKAGRVRPWMIMVAERDRAIPLAFEIIDDEEAPPAGLLWDLLDRAAREPMSVAPGRPKAIHFFKGKGWEELQPHLDELGIAAKSARKLAVLDELFESFDKHLGQQEPPGLLDVPGVTAEAVSGVFRAAAEFYRKAPWKRVSPEGAIRIECDRLLTGPRYAYLMGQGGMTLGVALYESLPLLRKLWKGKLTEEESIRETVALTLTFDPESHTPPKDVAAARKHHWEVAHPEAFPNIFRKGKGMDLRPPSPRELELLEGALRAILLLVARDGFEDGEVGRFSVTTGSGSVDFALSWVE